jgi:hypothetical protein
MSQVLQTARFLRRWWPIVVAGLIMAIVVAFAGLVWIIQASAHGRANLARAEFSGDEVEALVQYVQDQRHTLHDRNLGVWALGRFRDPRALPVLRRYYTGEKCQHDKFLCQSELKKAIDLCEGRRSGPAWMQKVLSWGFPRSRV